MTGKLFISVLAVVCLWVPYSGALAADADAGKEMYLPYCASCHGVDGKGNGAVARQVKIKPTDLTLLRQKNNGITLSIK